MRNHQEAADESGNDLEKHALDGDDREWLISRGGGASSGGSRSKRSSPLVMSGLLCWYQRNASIVYLFALVVLVTASISVFYPSFATKSVKKAPLVPHDDRPDLHELIEDFDWKNNDDVQF